MSFSLYVHLWLLLDLYKFVVKDIQLKILHRDTRYIPSRASVFYGNSKAFKLIL